MVFLLTVIGVIIDQLTKHIVMENMSLGESIPLVGNVFHLTYIQNHGAAFGMLEGQTYLFVVVALVLFGFIVYYRKIIGQGPLFLKVGASLLLSGAIGNAWDRLTLGGVVDFFDFRIWPIFNVADVWICVGVVLVAFYVFRRMD